VRGHHQRVLGVDVGRLDRDLATHLPKPLGEAVGGAALGVSAGPATLERAQLFDQLPAVGGVQGRRIIAELSLRAYVPIEDLH